MESIIPSDIPLGKYYTYTLAYPESMGGTVFYVGQGQGKRIDQHEWEAKNNDKRNPYKCNVIHAIWANGEQVVKTILAYFDTHKEACMYEIALIFFMDGLTNLTDGGEGSVGRKLSEETKRKISEGNIGRKRHYSEESRRRKSESSKGRVFSEEHRRKIGEASKGCKRPPLTEETRRKMSEAQKRRCKGSKVMSEEARRKISESKKGKPGMPRSEEWKRKISEGQKRSAKQKRDGRLF